MPHERSSYRQMAQYRIQLFTKLMVVFQKKWTTMEDLINIHMPIPALVDFSQLRMRK